MQIGSKQIIIGANPQILTISVIILLGGFLFYVRESNYLAGFLGNILSQNNNKIVEAVNENLDTDNDGLTDKMEKLIGTDFEKKDTDGDGYLDLEEIKNGYSPFVASPQGRFSLEEFAALKEKIKNIDQDFYEKTFILQNSPIVSASPEALITPVPIKPLLSGPAVFKEEVSLSNKNWKYSFYAPANIDLNKERSLVIGLHGFEGKSADYIRYWQSDADKNGFLVAVLQAYSKTYPGGATVESYPWLEISDFTKAVKENIEKKYKIDENRIFITGYSSGASASYIIALDSGIKFKGVIPIDGYLPLEAGIIDKLSKAKNVNFYVAHRFNDKATKATINQEKILLQYGAKMEFRFTKNATDEYPAAEHENILKWTNGL